MVKQYLESLNFSYKSAPWILLVACSLAYGIMSPWLGFYQDDWHFIYYANAYGVDNLWTLSSFDNRPFAAWPYIIGFTIFGFRPLAWQISAIFLRWLTSITFWLIYRSLWPKPERLSIISALIFTIYPLYILQPMAVTYITHWTSYLLFGLSLWLMVVAFQKPSISWPIYFLSVLLDCIQLFTIEYFNGIELIRPVIIWILLIKNGNSPTNRIKKTILRWLPYLTILLAFVIWRTFLYQSPGVDTNSPVVLRNLFTSPVSSIKFLATAVLKDFIIIQINAWGKLFQPSMVNLTPFGMFIFVIVSISFVLYLFYFRRLCDNKVIHNSSEINQMLAIGTLSVILGPIPAWLSNQPLYNTNPLWNSRLGMASMFGAAMVVTALVELLIRTRSQRQVVFSILISFSIGFSLFSANSYRNSWIKQTRFYNQLAWRAPSITPETPIISQGELLLLMGDYPTSFAMNMVYNPPTDPDDILIWYYPTGGSDEITNQIMGNQQISSNKFSIHFQGSAKNSLLIYYEPTTSQCLHFITKDDRNSRMYSDFLRQFARVSSVERIHPESNINEKFMKQAFGNQSKDWCYYFQKAELAAQSKNWDEIVNIWETRPSNSLLPTSGNEYLPFIKGYLKMQRWQDANNLTLDSVQETNTQAMRSILCSLWIDSVQTTDHSDAKIIQVEILSSLRCEN